LDVASDGTNPSFNLAMKHGYAREKIFTYYGTPRSVLEIMSRTGGSPAEISTDYYGNLEFSSGQDGFAYRYAMIIAGPSVSMFGSAWANSGRTYSAFQMDSTGLLTLKDSATSGMKLGPSGKIYPVTDSTTALQINKADGTTNVLNVDTTNSRIGILNTAPSLYLQGPSAASTAFTIGAGTPASTGNGNNLTLTGSGGVTLGNGGTVNITAGNAAQTGWPSGGGNGGSINLTAGLSGGNDSNVGGSITLTAGNVGAYGGGGVLGTGGITLATPNVSLGYNVGTIALVVLVMVEP
jgi:hypothetical protein